MTFAAPADSPAITDERRADPERPPFRVRAVCLDVDDTLVDYTGSAKHALAEMLGASHGVEKAWEIWQEVTDEHALAAVEGRIRYTELHALRTRAFFSAIGEEIDGTEAARREHARAEAMRAGWRLFPDARDSLDWLRFAGIGVAAVTNASGAHQRTKLADLGLAGAFDVVVIAGEVGVAKPDPVIFHTACRELGAAPGEVAHVGDKLDSDAMGADRAGLHGVWLDRAGHAEFAAPERIAVIESLTDLPELLVCGVGNPVVTPGRA